jgi:hypothetical protein
VWTTEIQTPGNHATKIIQYSQHGESLKSRTCQFVGNNGAGMHHCHVLIAE